MTGPQAANRPLILITMDLVEAGEGDEERHHEVRANYAEAVVEAGGLALFVPCEHGQLDEALALADGVLISGSIPGATGCAARVRFERDLIARALAAGKPLLGICHGMQLIGEHLGGRIVRDDPALLADHSLHMPHPTAQAPAHTLALSAGSSLAAWAGEAAPVVNSLHRHALSDDGAYRVIARAEDGIVEAIESLGPGFCVGLQWHPEYRLSSLDRAVFHAFIARCATWMAAQRRAG
jgi:gamma-glutamyl-gamma-aminobutyrate hydrolase PuuD